jgi:hypothetical protein
VARRETFLGGWVLVVEPLDGWTEAYMDCSSTPLVTQGGAQRRRRGLVILGLILILLAAVLILSRAGRRANQAVWDAYERELRQRGEEISWQKFVPPAIADAENFLKAPAMMAWFSKRQSASNTVSIFRLPQNGPNPMSLAKIKALPEATEQSAAASFGWPASRQDVWNWFAGVETNYELLVHASARPLARFDSDPSDPVEQMDVPNFVNIRSVAQAVATHANLCWVDQRPALALQDLQLLQRLAEVTASTPTLVGGMIRVAIWGLYSETVLGGLEEGALRDADLVAIQAQIKDVNLLDAFTRCLRAERAAELQLLTRSPSQIAKLLATNPAPGTRGFRFTLSAWNDWLEDVRLRFRLRSTAWMCQNKLTMARSYQEALDQVDASERVHAQTLATSFNRAVQSFSSSPEGGLARMLVPNCARAALVSAQKHTALSQLRVACGLERYRRKHGRYPESLNLLIPAYLDAVPNDVFTGRPLQYRRIATGGYQLWSVGWDEHDDDGLPGPLDRNGRPQFSEQGADWVLEERPGQK